jgi:protein-tyrosine phosphatase
MAEAMLREMAREADIPVEVRSAGVGAIDGHPVSAHAAEALRKRNLPVPGPSRMLTGEHVEWANLILTMTSSHKRAIIQRHPQAVEKTFTLKEYALHEGVDAAAAEELDRLVAQWQIGLATGQKMDEADLARLQELQQQMPDLDIADPFGGSLEMYEQCAEEIAESLGRVVDKLAAASGRKTD